MILYMNKGDENEIQEDSKSNYLNESSDSEKSEVK